MHIQIFPLVAGKLIFDSSRLQEGIFVYIADLFYSMVSFCRHCQITIIIIIIIIIIIKILVAIIIIITEWLLPVNWL